MGDRANIKFKFSNKKSIYLYTHWHGSELPHMLWRALAKLERWEDDSYLCRMVFSEMIKDNLNESTGFGISPFMNDNEHLIIGVNPEKQLVTFESEKGKVKRKFTFKDYVLLDEDTLNNVFNGSSFL